MDLVQKFHVHDDAEEASPLLPAHVVLINSSGVAMTPAKLPKSPTVAQLVAALKAAGLAVDAAEESGGGQDNG